MKKLLDGLRWDDKTKLIAAAAVTGALLLFAMLFPLAFRQSAAEHAAADAMPLGERAALFAAYWNAGEDERMGAEKLDAPTDEMAEACELRMRALIAACIDDARLGEVEPAGREYTRLRDGVRSMNVCRMWLEQKGDWQNWLDVCFDADTGALYYLYLSRECLTDRAQYPAAGSLDSAGIAALLAQDLGGALRHTEAGAAGGKLTAVVSAADGVIGYTIDCTHYDTLIDVKINCF